MQSVLGLNYFSTIDKNINISNRNVEIIEFTTNLALL